MIYERDKQWIRENGVHLKFYEVIDGEEQFTDENLPATEETIKKLEKCCGIYEYCNAEHCKMAYVAHPLLDIGGKYIHLCNLLAGEFIGNRRWNKM
jgi:hypothetical protein